MSHLSAHNGSACISNRYQPMQPGRGTGSGPACYKLPTAGSYAAHSEMLRTKKGNWTDMLC